MTEIKIRVKTIDSSLFDLKIQKTNLIATLKEKIEESLNIPFISQRLIFHGKILQNDNSLAHYEITNDSVIHLLIKKILLESHGNYYQNQNEERLQERLISTIDDEEDTEEEKGERENNEIEVNNTNEPIRNLVNSLLQELGNELPNLDISVSNEREEPDYEIEIEDGDLSEEDVEEVVRRVLESEGEDLENREIEIEYEEESNENSPEDTNHNSEATYQIEINEGDGNIRTIENVSNLQTLLRELINENRGFEVEIEYEEETQEENSDDSDLEFDDCTEEISDLYFSDEEDYLDNQSDFSFDEITKNNIKNENKNNKTRKKSFMNSVVLLMLFSTLSLFIIFCNELFSRKSVIFSIFISTATTFLYQLVDESYVII